MAFIFTLLYVGRFLPKDTFPVLHSKEHNKNVWQLFPLVANIMFAWITLGKLFVDYPFKEYSTRQCVLAYLSLMYLIPGSIDASHELIHRPQMIFRVMGFANMAVMQFSVYPIEHIYLHHKMVGSKKDPITSPKNKNFYLYTFQAMISAHTFVYKWSKKAFAICILSNLTYLAIMFSHAMNEHGDWQIAAWKVFVFFGISFGAFAFLEVVEYVEHYGLVCRSDEEEKVSEQCSWNSEVNILHNWLIFRFQRHSDHHMNAYKVYTTMELNDKMPKFPFRFLDATLIALTPPLWYYIANPYVDEVLEKKSISKSHHSFVKYLLFFISTTALLAYLNMAYQAYQAYQL